MTGLCASVLPLVQWSHAPSSQDIHSLLLLFLPLLLLDPLCLKDVIDTHLLQRLAALQLCILQGAISHKLLTQTLCIEHLIYICSYT